MAPTKGTTPSLTGLRNRFGLHVHSVRPPRSPGIEPRSSAPVISGNRIQAESVRSVGFLPSYTRRRTRLPTICIPRLGRPVRSTPHPLRAGTLHACLPTLPYGTLPSRRVIHDVYAARYLRITQPPLAGAKSSSFRGVAVRSRLRVAPFRLQVTARSVDYAGERARSAGRTSLFWGWLSCL